MNQYIGICVGAQSISIVSVEKIEDNITVKNLIQQTHNGNPQNILHNFFSNFNNQDAKIVVTGRKFRHIMAVTNISETEASAYALDFIGKKYPHLNFDAIISLGAETFMLYNIIDNKITDVYAKNKCAAGTGEFFQQQIKRMDLSLDEVNGISESVASYKVSGRCSVFCKSDCTHALNKGVSKDNIVVGLCQMLADKIEELIQGKNKGKILLAGGVTRNKLTMKLLGRRGVNYELLPESTYFEALGAAIFAMKNEENLLKFPELDQLFSSSKSSFVFNKPLTNFTDKVTFKSIEKRQPHKDETCILGLDVGSTTTKAVLISNDEKPQILASVYLYTNGNPVLAAKNCYADLLKQLPDKVNIIGLGTTGSGRQIAALHALTTSVYNEITAHATAAVFYDKEVDTIFEIGGQDAKYTHIVNRVPTDYAMNEACSAGTGSFIEEAAKESLNVNLLDIEGLAFQGKNPPNFSDQCAAFISSDIKTAQQEGLSREDIVAGLTYSICQNYLNRVKSNRPVGKKIFMQGGVCYNKAVPVAMAALSDSEIIVPPEPGLMGAFGVALQVKERIALGITEEEHFNLEELASRDIKQVSDFICSGGKEGCDLKCKIALFDIEGKKYAFGGACNKYNRAKNEVHSNQNLSDINEEIDLVKVRNYLVFEKYAPKVPLPEATKSIGINLSFYTHSLFPLYYNFFTKLGFKIVLSENLDFDNLWREHTSFCFPMQISLCLFQDLLKQQVDYIFAPAIFEMDAEKEEVQRLDFNCACAFVTGEPYVLSQAYKDFAGLKDKIISPSLNFSNGFEAAKDDFIKIAKQISGKKNIEEEASLAFDFAVKMQKDCQNDMRKTADNFLKNLRKNPDNFAIVLFGRSYNSTYNKANKGIPKKFTSQSIPVIPIDMIDISESDDIDRMYWEAGHRILKVAKIVKDDPQLFATYITNFSCAPDSMLLNTFRDIMQEKPSLTLELDSHSADAGINTRIEAAVDIITNYRGNKKNIQNSIKQKDFVPARIEYTEPIATFVSSSGESVPLTDPRVVILIPAMGDLASKMVAAAFKSSGINSVALPTHSTESLQLGRKYASGKECLPILLMAGNLLKYLENPQAESQFIIYFQVQGAGNCRLGQYPVFLDQLISNRKLTDIVQMVLMNEDGFAGLGTDWSVRAIQAIIISDVLDDIRAGILTHAVDPKTGIEIFDREVDLLLEKFAKAPKDIYGQLEKFAKVIKNNVPSKTPIEDFKYVALIGEIFCRRDEFANKKLDEYFAKNGFVLKTAYISEWITYIDYLISIDLLESEKSLKKRFERMLRNFYMKDIEKKIKKALEISGYYKFERMNVEPILKHSKHIVPLEYKGEPGLTLGIALNDILDKYCGVINFGPFGCMPTRFAEAVTVPEMTIGCKVDAKRLYNKTYKVGSNGKVFPDNFPLPFLTIESDGAPYSQLIEARLDAFLLQCQYVAENFF